MLFDAYGRRVAYFYFRLERNRNFLWLFSTLLRLDVLFLVTFFAAIYRVYCVYLFELREWRVFFVDGCFRPDVW